MIRLIVPPELQQLPWESFYDESRRGFLLNHRQYTLIREAERVESTPRVGKGKLPVGMLVVVPDGSRLKVESELHQLAVVVDKLGANIEYVELAERVTSTKLGEQLRKRHWDIVHFIGHGDLIKGKAHIRLNTDGEEDNWMYGEQFAMLFDEKAPRLVVLNCCYGGREAATADAQWRGAVPAARRRSSGGGDAIRHSRCRGQPLFRNVLFRAADGRASGPHRPGARAGAQAALHRSRGTGVRHAGAVSGRRSRATLRTRALREQAC